NKGAEFGNDKCEYILGKFMEHGKMGFRKNLEQALMSYEKAAKKNNSDALLRLAKAHKYGELGLKKDIIQTANILLQGVKSKDGNCIVELIELFMNKKKISPELKSKLLDIFRKEATEVTYQLGIGL